MLKIIIFIIFFIKTSHAFQKNLPIGYVADRQNIYLVKIANNKHAREQGLMFQSYLPSYTGMLFVFNPANPKTAFWMKNTFIPLDIRFYNKNGKLINRYPKAMPCINNYCKNYPAFGKTTFVLESSPRMHKAIIPYQIPKTSNLQIIYLL